MIKKIIVLLLLVVISQADRTVNYPVRFAYIDAISAWWPPESIAAGMGVPGFAQKSNYNYFALAFWLSSGPTDIALIWSNPVAYFGTTSQFGSTNK